MNQKRDEGIIEGSKKVGEIITREAISHLMKAHINLGLLFEVNKMDPAERKENKEQLEKLVEVELYLQKKYKEYFGKEFEPVKEILTK